VTSPAPETSLVANLIPWRHSSQPVVQRKTLPPETWKVVAHLWLELAAEFSPAAAVHRRVQAEASQDVVAASVAPQLMRWNRQERSR